MYEEITMFTCFHSYMRKIIAKVKASYTTHMYGFAYIRVYASKIDPLVCHHHRIVCKHFHMNCKHVCYSHKVDSYDDDDPRVVSNIKTRSHHQRAHHSHKTNYTDGTSVLCFVYACDAPQKSYKWINNNNKGTRLLQYTLFYRFSCYAYKIKYTKHM